MRARSWLCAYETSPENMKTLVAMVLNGLASLVAQTIKIYLKCRRPGLSLWVREMPWGRAWKPNSSILAGRIL